MASEAAPITSPPAPTTDASASAPNGTSDPVEATSEANIAAADPNPPNAIPDPEKNDANLDEKAADLAEGAESGATVIAPEASGTPASNKKGKDNKRRSSGVPEHKSKKKGGKKEVVLNLDCQPGDYYFARMKGHPPWPSIICDEEMLPEAIMATRPVTARRVDGTFRPDYDDGGKNAKDRTYPVMFLHTNEFAWMPNIDLVKIADEDLEDLENKKLPKKGLLDAHKLAAAKHPLDHYKHLLMEFENARREEESKYMQKMEEKEAKLAKKQEKFEQAANKAAKAKRKSSAGVEDEDVEMEDSSEAPKSSKKRKKAEATSGDDETPAKKTPKIKLNSSKTPNGDSAAKSSTKKPKSTKPKEPAPVMSEQEKLDKKQQSVLYLRHKLQKGFLQNTAPKESEMGDMAGHFNTLEQYKELEVNIIKNTKIHKVLKAILKLDHVPKDEEHGFKKRSDALLSGWMDAMTKEDEGARSGQPATNGDAAEKPAEATTEEPTKTEDTEMKDAPAVTEPPAAPVEATNPGNDAKDEAVDGDVSMDNAVIVEKSEIPAEADAPAAPAAPAEAPAATTEA